MQNIILCILYEELSDMWQQDVANEIGSWH